MFHELARDDIYRLETPKLWLRWPRLTDAPNLARFLADHEVTKMTSRIPHPYPPEEAERFVFETRRNNSDGQSIGLVITPNAKPAQAIGAITLAPTEVEGELVIGYWLGVPFWGAWLCQRSGKRHDRYCVRDEPCQPDNCVGKNHQSRVTAGAGTQWLYLYA